VLDLRDPIEARVEMHARVNLGLVAHDLLTQARDARPLVLDLRGGDGHDARRRRGDEDRLGAHHLARVSKHQKWGSSRITRLACSRRVASREVPGCLRRGRASTRRATLPLVVLDSRDPIEARVETLARVSLGLVAHDLLTHARDARRFPSSCSTCAIPSRLASRRMLA
jgi:hypothetical protein